MLRKLKEIVPPELVRAGVSGALEIANLMQKAGIMKSAGGAGVIFMLHLVRPHDQRTFRPNESLEVTPEFLDIALSQLTSDGFDFISLDAVPDRLANGPADRRFAVFTLDDGYRNNLEYAAPVFSRHNAPFTVFVTKGFVERSHSMWWETLAEVLNATDSLSIDLGDGVEKIACASLAEKAAAFGGIAGLVNSGDEAAMVKRLDAAAPQYGVEPLAVMESLTMSPAELASLCENPLASLGAHTISHRGLCRLDNVEARQEILGSAECVQTLTGKWPRTFAYPYGDGRSVSPREAAICAEFGMDIAVTTRANTLHHGASGAMTLLPRISINGLYQKARYVSALASGIPFRLAGR